MGKGTVTLFVMKDNKLVIGEVVDSMDNTKTLIKRPRLIDFVQVSQNNIAPQMMPYPHPFLEAFLNNLPEEVEIENTDILYKYDEFHLKDEFLKMYLSQTSPIALSETMPKDSKIIPLKPR